MVGWAWMVFIIVSTVAMRMVLPGRPLWAYLFPLPAVSMLLAILIDAQLAMVVGGLLSIVLAVTRKERPGDEQRQVDEQAPDCAVREGICARPGGGHPI